ncbi:MAG: SDR family oxidoreductase [Gammaproteobacteria bacterium]|nr:SDR family oxidoreductase [Gammaproteobacteria bacterium]
MKHILIVGAGSAIAEACARLWSAEGAALHLVARDPARLAAMADDLALRGAARVSHGVADVARMDDAGDLVDAARAALGGLDLVLVAQGVLPNQRACERDFAQARAAFEVNTLASLAVLTRAAVLFEEQGHGALIVLGSVAGDRGRASNYVYGASKAALEVFASGLRNRLARRGVQVLLVKPGFVDTPMTAAFTKGPLWAQPADIARGILRALETRRDVVYLPAFWRAIMLVIRLLPERVFKRLTL